MTLTITDTPKANSKDHKVVTVYISGKYCETKVGIIIPRSAPEAPPLTVKTIVLTVLEFC